MVKAVEWIVNEESGQGIVEYSFMLALVVLVIISALTIFGEETYMLFNDIKSRLP